MSFYTRKGDDGSTGLLGQGRVSKSDDRIEAVGSLDESSAALGMARALARDERCGPLLLEVQRDLYRLMSEVAAAPQQAPQFRFENGRAEWLEQQIEKLAATVEMPGEFIVPGDSVAGAAMSIGRATVRRAERRLVELFKKDGTANPVLLQYLNRLSSLLFVLELVENQAAGKPTTKAKTPD